MTIIERVLSPAPASVPAKVAETGLVPAAEPRPPGLAALPPGLAGGRTGSAGHAARLAGLVLGTPSVRATVVLARPSAGKRPPGGEDLPGEKDRPGGRDLPGGRGPPGNGDRGPDITGELTPAERSWCQYVIDSGTALVVDDVRLDPRTPGGHATGPAGVIAWAGFPLRGPDGRVAGAFCAADARPRHWSAGDIELLATLSHVAASEVALQVALRDGAERAELARTLQESLLPPRLARIPGLQVAAWHMAGGTGAEVLGDFYDVFPSVLGNWGMVVGDVCGKGVPAAKSTALARYTVRAEAHRETRPSLILAALNQALLDWLTDDPRFLTAIYATVRPTLAGASVQISAAGHPLALVRRADGRVQASGRPGTLLGIFPDPELHDSRKLLRAGDSLVLFTDGVTEARRRGDRDLYGDRRLRDLLAGLPDMSAARTAAAIQQAVRAFSGPDISDDAVALVLKVPGRQDMARDSVPPGR
jgi:sigma-B regulation protein RsbU (phosphoserine phosphatase)